MHARPCLRAALGTHTRPPLLHNAPFVKGPAGRAFCTALPGVGGFGRDKGPARGGRRPRRLRSGREQPPRRRPLSPSALARPLPTPPPARAPHPPVGPGQRCGEAGSAGASGLRGCDLALGVPVRGPGPLSPGETPDLSGSQAAPPSRGPPSGASPGPARPAFQERVGGGGLGVLVSEFTQPVGSRPRHHGGDCR